MSSIREMSLGKQDIWKIDPRKIKMRPDWNARDEGADLEAHIDSIALSIKTRGYDQAKPLILHMEGEDYCVSDGHCRLRSVMRCIEQGVEILSVPVVMEARGANEADRVAGILTRNAGKPLSPLEQGRVYVRLQGFGWDDQRIADTSGKSITHIQQIFQLMEADPATHALVQQGRVSATAVANAVRTHGAEKAKVAVKRAVRSAGANGQGKATGEMVKAAAAGGKFHRPRPLSEILAFFKTTVKEQDGPPGVILLSSLFLEFRAGEISAEKFMSQLAEMVRQP